MGGFLSHKGGGGGGQRRFDICHKKVFFFIEGSPKSRKSVRRSESECQIRNEEIILMSVWFKCLKNLYLLTSYFYLIYMLSY